MKNLQKKGILISIAICAFFAIFVSGTAVLLRPQYLDNQKMFIIHNILDVAQLSQENTHNDQKLALEIYQKNVRPIFIDLQNGTLVPPPPDHNNYDMMDAAKGEDTGYDAPQNLVRIKRLPKIARLFVVTDDNHSINTLLLPIHGAGLWSTIMGYLAIQADAQTIKGVTFYSHGETPGLGGEIDNPNWKNKWKNKKIFDTHGNVAIKITKGHHNDDYNNDYNIDAISGATLTCNAVTQILQFWLSTDAYGKFIHNYAKDNHLQIPQNWLDDLTIENLNNS